MTPTSTQPLRVSALTVYPVKSMAGWPMTAATVVDTGFHHDREWMVIDAQGNFVSQRQFPKLALVRPTLLDNALSLDAPGQPTIQIPILNDGERISTEVWSSPCQTIHQGSEAADWVSAYLGAPCRLVRMDPANKRALSPKYQVSGTEVVGFADRLPFLLATEASLADLNGRLTDPVTMSRFRPNVVVTGCKAFAEDTWKRIKIGPVVFRVQKACDRCEIVTVNQDTGQKGIEPLETLGRYRTQPKGIMFGQIMIQENQGDIRVGDAVEILK